MGPECQFCPNNDENIQISISSDVIRAIIEQGCIYKKTQIGFLIVEIGSSAILKV